MTGLIQGIRHAARSLASDPVYVVAATLILALGIGVNIAVVSAARSVFFPALPFPQPNELVAVYERAPTEGISKFNLSYVNYMSVREQKTVFRSVAVYISPSALRPFDLTEPGEPQKLAGAVVSPNFFDVLRAQPVLGTTFVESMDSGEPERAVVIGYHLWQEVFGGSPSALGKSLAVNKRIYVVAGVMPLGFSFPGNTDLWLAGTSPSTVNSILNSSATFTEYIPRAVARLQPGIDARQAEILLQIPLSQLTEPHVQGAPRISLNLVPLYDDLFGDVRQPVAILTGAAAFVLLIAWVVVSILCWIRAMRREKEIAIRAALGAGKWRCMLQFVVESGLVALVGCVAAILVGKWTARVIPTLIPSPGLTENSGLADWHLLIYLVSVGVLSALLPGIWSSWNAGRIDLARTLQEGSYTSSLGPGRRRMLSVMAAILVALAFVLTAAAGLMIDNFRRITNVSLGWSTADVWMSSFHLHGPEIPTRRLAFLLDSAITKTKRLPGISAVAIADAVPIPGSSMHNITVARAEGSSRQLPPDGQNFYSMAVSPEYFNVLGIPLIEGRWFNEADCLNSAAVAIVDQSFARYFWPQSSALGRQMTASRMADGRVVTIVGVVGTTRTSGYFTSSAPVVYTAIPSRLPSSASWLLMKMQSRVPPPISGIRHALSDLADGTIPSEPDPAAELVAEAGALPRARAAILMLFGILAITLAVAGTYAVTAYGARQRVRELGIRMALGATRGGIVMLLVGQTFLSLAMGLTVGWIVVLGLAPIFRALLYHPQATDRPLLVVISTALCCAVLLASLLPAWRVATIDLTVTLRHE
jgi:predicted permease